MKRAFVLLALTCILPFAPHGEAGTINLVGTNDPTLTATLDFNISGSVLTVDVTNTSVPFNPVITGFDFNVPSGVTGFSSFTVFEGATNVTTNWDAIFDLNDLNTPGQFGFFDIETDSDNTPSSIFKGETFRFTFNLTGTTAGLTQDSFITALSFDPAGNPDETEVAALVRFQQTGENGRGSDVAIPGTAPAVPEPATVVLLGTALTGLVAFARRRSGKE